MKTILSKYKAQVSNEFILVTGILLLIFVVVLFFSAYRKKEVDEMKTFLEKTRECERIARMISSLYATGDGAEARTRTKYNARTENKSLFVDNVECNFFANANQTNFTGNVIIKNKRGKIFFENETKK